MKRSQQPIIDTTGMETLLTLVEEAARSTQEGVKHFVEPAPGTLRRASSKRHHIVFGRRGSGKSSLLRKAAADLTIDRRPIANVNLEAFKGHSYPDVLLSILIATLTEFRAWMDTAGIHPARRTTFWQKLFGTTPRRPSFNRKATSDISETMSGHIEALNRELHRTDDADLRVKSGYEESENDSVSLKGRIGLSGASSSAESGREVSQRSKEEVEEKYKRSKMDFLHRSIMEFQAIFKQIAAISGGDSYLFLDDLYHIRRSDQARVIDYFHRIAKDHSLWLKIGTIRHRTLWYSHGDPPIGMKLGDDADEIDLDLTLEKYSLAKDFLLKILRNFSSTANLVPLASFLTDGAQDRLVLASGGVARDFLSIFRRSVDIARERKGGHRGDKVGAEDVNAAAGEYDSSKREEFKRDTFDDDSGLQTEFINVRNFCFKNNTNCFLMDKDEIGDHIRLVHELVDLKFIHLVKSRVTVSGRPGKIYEAYMLDLSQYSGARKRRDLEMVEFWKPTSTEALRRKSMIYPPQLKVDKATDPDEP